MNKIKQPVNAYESGITELTLEDIKKNLKKPTYNDFLDLDNVYDFLNRFTSSKGRSGFITIKKPETRKRSYEPPKPDYQDFKDKTLSPNPIRQKSFIASPTTISTTTSPKVHTKQLALLFLSPPEHTKFKKNPVSLKKSSKSPAHKVTSQSLLKHNLKIKNFETTRERALSPNAIFLQKSAKKLPLLQTSKKLISVLKLSNSKKSKNKAIN